MATQEERLASLESFRTETLYAYKDMAYEVTILKGLGEDSIKRLAVVQRDMSEVKATLETHTDLLKQILDRLPTPAKE